MLRRKGRSIASIMDRNARERDKSMNQEISTKKMQDRVRFLVASFIICRMSVSILLVSILLVSMLPVRALAAVLYMPDVTSAMSKASYWSDKLGDPDRILADPQDVVSLNKSIWKTSKETRDMANWSQAEYDACARVKLLISGAKDDADYFYSLGARYDGEGNRVGKDALYGPLIDLCKDPDVNLDGGVQMRKTLYAICTNRTSLQAYPTSQALGDDPKDPDFDYNYLTLVKVNEPVLLRTKSADGKYYAALTCCGSGWIPAKDVAICQDRNEWLDAWHYPADQVLVVYDDKIYTEDSNSQPETANRKITMGSRLQLASEEECQGRISNRTAHNNHVVWMPVRKSDGTYEKKLALIGESKKVHEGCLPLTAENIMKVAMNQLGDTYGWGSMLQSEDCSGFCRDVYACFGLDLPRGCGRNNGVMKEYNLSSYSDEDKAAFIKRLPIGTILNFPGHEMLYLGYEGDKIYVLSSVSNIRMPGASSNTRVRGAIINTLDIWRANNRTWLNNLTLALIPFYSSDHPDHTFSLAKADIQGVSNCIYNGKEQTCRPKVLVNGTLLEEGTDYSLTFKDNIKPGTAKMIIEGKGLYCGTAQATFSIMKKEADPGKKEEKSSEPSETPILLASMKAKGKNQLKISWTRVPGASGYDIYMARCSKAGKKTSFKKVKTIKNANKTSWTKKKLKKRTSYKAYVRAYTIRNGKKIRLAASPDIHTYTTGGNAKYTNPKAIRLRTTSTLTLKAGEISRIRGEVKKQGENKSKKKKLIKCTDPLRFISTDIGIADVSLSGRVVARKKGTAYIYVYAVNGIWKRIKVVVR